MGFSDIAKTCFIQDMMKNNLEFIGRNIRVIRRKHGLTLAQLAGKIGIQEGPLGRIERGLNSPSARVIYRLSKVFDVSIDTLFAEDDQTFYRRRRVDEQTPYPLDFISKVELSKKSRLKVDSSLENISRLEKITGLAPKVTIPARFPFEMTEDGVTALAADVRHAMGLGDQTAVDYDLVFERVGFRPLHLPLREDIAGLTRVDPAHNSAFFILNANVSSEERTFKMVSELGALLIWLRSLDGQFPAAGDELPPAQASELFAAAFLTPERVVRSVIRRLGVTPELWTFDLLRGLKSRFGVPAGRFLERLRELDLIHKPQASALSRELSDFAVKSRNAEPSPYRASWRPNGRVEEALALAAANPETETEAKAIAEALAKTGLLGK